MFVELKNFRCHPYKKLEFNKGLNLLSGESGIGKSTIFEAIEWCFYGGKGAYPFGFDGKKKEFTQVKICIQDKTITRTKPPDFLKVELENKILEFEEAQKYIDYMFGSKKLWETSSYIKQDFKNFLLLAPNQTKTEIIKEIVLDDDTSDHYLNCLEKYLNNIDGKIQYIENSDPSISKNDGLIMSMNYQEDIEGWKNYSLKKNEIQERLSLLKEKKEIEEKILSFEDNFPENLTYEELNNWEIFLKSGGNFENYQLNENLLSEDLKSIELQVYKFEENKEKSLRLGVKYDKVSINQRIDELKLEKEYLHLHSLFIELKKIENSIQKFNSEKPSIDKKYRIIRKLLKLDENILYDSKDFEKIKNLIEMKSGNFLVCPECKCNLILKEKKLEKFDNVLEGKEKIYTTLRYVNDYYKKLKDLENKHQKIKEEMELHDLDLEKLNFFKPSTKKDIDTFILNLQKIEFYPNLKKEYKNILLAKTYHPKFKNFNFPKNKQKYFKDYNTLNYLKEQNKKLSVSSNLSISKLKDYLNKADIYEKYKEFKKKQNEYFELIDKKSKTITIKNIVIETKNQVLEELIESLNSILENLTQDIFDNISIKIQMFKKIKVKKNIKAECNFEIKIKNYVYENINSLSGGEKDRISFCITLAFSILSNNPIIMLDESISSLNEDMKIKCLNLIKNYVPEKYVFLVCHDIVHGFFDNVIFI